MGTGAVEEEEDSVQRLGQELLKRRKTAFRDGDRELLSLLRENKEAFRRKQENKLQQNNMREVWLEMKMITGFKAEGNQAEGSLNSCPEVGVEDAIIYLLQQAISHLDKAGSTVRIMFFDFSSAFNTIQS